MVKSNDVFDQILADGPSPGTFFRVLSKMKEEGQLKRVIQECIKALKIYPYDIQIRQLLAECYFEAGLLAQAEEELDKVTKQLGVFVSAYKLQAEVYSRQKRVDDASKTLSLYLAHKPEDRDAKIIFERLERAKKSAETTPSLQPEKISSRLESVRDDIAEIATPTLAEVYVNQGQIPEAVNIYEKVLARSPDDEHVKQRLEGLKSQLAAESSGEGDRVDRVREKKKRMLAILETWRANLRLITNTSLTA